MLGIFSIIKFELSRFKRTLLQSLVVPIITTFLYLLVFGQAIGRSVSDYEINYALFIVPGVILLSVFNESLNNSSFGIYLPRFTGTIFEVLSSPLSSFQILVGYVFAATLKSVLIGLFIIILGGGLAIGFYSKYGPLSYIFLGVFSLLDFVLYKFTDFLGVCYSCSAEYYQVDGVDTLENFEHHNLEMYQN